MKMFPRRLHVFILLVLTAFGTSAQAGPEPVDPLVGDWLYYRNEPTTFQADGTAQRQGGERGTWEYLHNPEVQRHYRLVWNGGKSIDTLILAEGGQYADIRNETGAHLRYKVRRAITDKPAVVVGVTTPTAAAKPTPDLTDPIIGDWQWYKGSAVKFLADGTMISSTGTQGTWAFLHNPEAARKYVLVWNYGVYTDHLTYNRAARTGHIVNQKGDAFDVAQGVVVPGTPTNYFGVPGR